MNFSYELGYTALIAADKQRGILALINSDRDELVTWDTLLNKEIFDLTKIKLSPSLEQNENTIVMYSFPPGRVIIQLDDRLDPVAWSK